MNFDKWINEAYREPESTNFTVANMEVAYQAGLNEAKQSFLEILTYIEGCFSAAQTEGLIGALIYTQDDGLKDLVERRLMYAWYKAEEAIKEMNNET